MKRHLLTTAFFVTSIFLGYTQSYTFDTYNDTYTNLESPTSLNGEMTWFDPDFTIPIGFDFYLFDEHLDTFYISSEVSASVIVDNQVEEGSFVAAILPFTASIVDRNIDYETFEPSATGSASSIAYKTEGVSGSRIFKLEWKNVGFEGDISDFEENATDYVSFQIWCYEASNVIEFRYGESHFEHFSTSFDEETGPIIGLFPSVSEEDGPNQNGSCLQGSASNPSLISTMEPIYLDGVPSENTVYRFTPSTSGIEDNSLLIGKIMPNPATDFIIIQNVNGVQSGFIYDSLGRLIKAFNTKKVDIQNLDSGIYFVKIVDDHNQLLTKKFIKS